MFERKFQEFSLHELEGEDEGQNGDKILLVTLVQEVESKEANVQD